MKKLSLLLALGLGLFTTMQPAAAPKEGIPVARPAKYKSEAPGAPVEKSDYLWEPGPKELPNEAWRKILSFVGIDEIRHKLFKNLIVPPCLTINTGSAVESIAYSPDGKHIVTGSWDNTAKIWDAQTGQEVHTLRSHNGRISSIAYSPDGQRIATGSGDTAKIWNAQTGQEISTLHGHNQKITSVAYSPDGKHIVTGSVDNTAKIWNAQTGQEISTLHGHNNMIRSVAYSPDNKHIVTGSSDNTARIWDVETGQEITLHDHLQVTSVAYSPDGQHIATGFNDNKVKIWNAQTGQEIGVLYRNWKIGGSITSVAYSPDGKYIATGSEAYSPDGQHIATESAKIWSAQTRQEIGALRGHNHWIKSVAYSPDGKHIVTGSWDDTAKIWDISMLNQKFNPEQMQILRLLDVHEQQRNRATPFLLKDIERNNKRAQILGLQSKFEDLFPRDIRDNIVDTYKIADWICLPEPEDSVALYQQEIKDFAEAHKLAGK